MKEHTEDGMDMHVFRDESEPVYVSNLARFVRGVEVGLYPENWLGYCMLSSLHHTLPFLNGSKDWRNATNSDRRHRTESYSPFLTE